MLFKCNRFRGYFSWHFPDIKFYPITLFGCRDAIHVWAHLSSGLVWNQFFFFFYQTKVYYIKVKEPNLPYYLSITVFILSPGASFRIWTRVPEFTFYYNTHYTTNASILELQKKKKNDIKRNSQVHLEVEEVVVDHKIFIVMPTLSWIVVVLFLLQSTKISWNPSPLI